MKLSKLIVCAVVLASALTAVAQERRSPLGLGGNFQIMRPEVQADLKLSEEQKSKLQPVILDLQNQNREGLQLLQTGAAKEERMKKIAESQAEAEKKIVAILSAEQLKRLKQLCLQHTGMWAVQYDAEVREALKFTAEQNEKVRLIMTESREARHEVIVSTRGGFSPEEVTKKMAAIDKQFLERTAALLTDEQKAKWKDLLGEPLKTQ